MRDVVVVELSDGLVVTLPLELARELLRPLLSATDLCQVQETLRLTPAPNQDSWIKRTKNTQVKLTRGDPVGLAEVVRDTSFRQRTLLAKKGGAFLSSSERALYTRARRLLAGEVGLANDLDPEEADAWITEQLAS